MTYDIDLKQFGKNIQTFKSFRKNNDIPFLLFFHRKSLFKNTFADTFFI